MAKRTKLWTIAATGGAVLTAMIIAFAWFVVPSLRSTGYNLEDTLGRSLPESATNIRYKRSDYNWANEFVVPYTARIRAEMDRETYNQFLDEIITSNRTDAPVSEEEIRRLEEAQNSWIVENLDLEPSEPPDWWPAEFDPNIVRTTGRGGGAYDDLTYRHSSRYIDGEMFLMVDVNFKDGPP